MFWSGREDSNLRLPAPKAGALPGCATPRLKYKPKRITKLLKNASILTHRSTVNSTSCPIYKILQEYSGANIYLKFLIEGFFEK